MMSDDEIIERVNGKLRETYERERARETVALRDHFAGQALAGHMAQPGRTFLHMPTIAQHCYQMADAMLAERSK